MTTTKPIIVYGAGGLARETRWLIERINQHRPQYSFAGYVVTDTARLGAHDSVDEVVGDEAWLLAQDDVFVAIGIGSPAARTAIGRRLSTQLDDNRFPVLVDPTAVYDARTCTFEPGAIVTAANVLTVHVRVRRFAFLNLDCTVGHEADIGEGVVMNPSVNISGGVVIGHSTLVGTGAQILQYAQIGAEATVGAGAVVNKDVPAGTTVVGVPAKPLRRG